MLVLQDDDVIFQNLYVLFGEACFKVVIAELADGNKCTVV